MLSADALPDTAVVVIAYRDSEQASKSLPFYVKPIVGDTDDLLEDGELMEITVFLSSLAPPLDGEHRLHARNQAPDRLRHRPQPHHARRARTGHGTAVISI